MKERSLSRGPHVVVSLFRLDLCERDSQRRRVPACIPCLNRDGTGEACRDALAPVVRKIHISIIAQI